MGWMILYNMAYGCDDLNFEYGLGLQRFGTYLIGILSRLLKLILIFVKKKKKLNKKRDKYKKFSYICCCVPFNYFNFLSIFIYIYFKFTFKILSFIKINIIYN